MQKAEEITVGAVQEAISQRAEVEIAGIELTLRKLVLSALTMLGVGFIMVNIPVTVLQGYYWSTIPISSQANVAAISGRAMYILGSIAMTGLGGLIVLGGVRFYEGNKTKMSAFLCVLLASFYLLCFGIGVTLLQPSSGVTGFLFLAVPLLAMVGAAAFLVPDLRFKIVGSIVGIVGGFLLAYVLVNQEIFGLVFDWGMPFVGPFMSLQSVEAVLAVLGPAAALVYSFAESRRDAKPLAHAVLLSVGLVYGVGVLIGSLFLSMSLWNLIWKSPWVGPLNSLPSWVTSTVVFWSASLFLVTIGGILLIITAGVGFAFVSKEFARQNGV